MKKEEKTQPFETALKDLEKIVGELEKGQVSLDESVALYARGRSLQFRNSNGLVKSAEWDIGLSKTGYISEAGRCLVMQAQIAARPVVIVLLDSWGKNTRIGDANRIKKWLESRLGRKPVG